MTVQRKPAKTWLLISSVHELHARISDITRQGELKSAVFSQPRSNVCVRHATSLKQPLSVTCRWPGANATSVLFAAHVNDSLQPWLLLTHIWSHGDIDKKLFGCKVNATR